MELITANEVSQRTGLSPATVALYAKQGKFPTHEDSNGRRRFVLGEVQDVIDSQGIKPRPRKKDVISGSSSFFLSPPHDDAVPAGVEASALAEPEDEEQPAGPAVPAQAAEILAVAIRRARMAFKRTIVEELNRRLNDDEAPLDQENELVALRFHMRSEDVFNALRQELTS